MTETAYYLSAMLSLPFSVALRSIWHPRIVEPDEATVAAANHCKPGQVQGWKMDLLSDLTVSS